MTQTTTQQRTSQPSRRNNSRPNQNGKPQGSGKQQFGKGKSRYAAKKNRRGPAKPFRKPLGPVKEYISSCCSLPAIKPRAGAKESVKNPETGKVKEQPKGLGHWRCTGCRKSTKVTPRKPVVVEATPVQETPVVSA
jgi:hypothetical protein